MKAGAEAPAFLWKEDMMAQENIQQTVDKVLEDIAGRRQEAMGKAGGEKRRGQLQKRV